MHHNSSDIILGGECLCVCVYLHISRRYFLGLSYHVLMIYSERERERLRDALIIHQYSGLASRQCRLLLRQAGGRPGRCENSFVTPILSCELCYMLVHVKT